MLVMLCKGEAREDPPHFTEDFSLRLIDFKGLVNTFRNLTRLKGFHRGVPNPFQPMVRLS
jgi:hypothetical protein